MPKPNITFGQMFAALQELGFGKDPERSGPKHTTYARPGEKLFVLVPAKPDSETVWVGYLTGVRLTLRYINPADEKRFDQILGLPELKTKTVGGPKAATQPGAARTRENTPGRGAGKKVKT